MRRLFVTRCAILLALAAATALAADVTGTWTAKMGGPDGGDFTMTFHFKQDGTKLTGTVDGPQGDTLQISEGKVEGNKISFVMTGGGGGGDMKITQEGTISGDEIKLTMKMEGGPDGGRGGPPDGGRGGPPEGGRGGPGGQITLTRVK